MNPCLNLNRQFIANVQAIADAMVKVDRLPAAYRHYGEHRQAILTLKKKNFSIKEIASILYAQGIGPHTKGNPARGLNVEAAAQYISRVIHHPRG